MSNQAPQTEYRVTNETPVPPVDARMSAVLRIEWALLIGRYLALFTLVGLYAAGITPAYSPDLRILTIAYLLQNTFTHWVLYQERYHLFVSPMNFVFYVANSAITVGLTGAEESPVALLIVLPIIGYCVYTPQFLNTMSMTLICASSYTFMVLIHWLLWGVNLAYPPIGLHLGLILLVGWLMGSLGELLKRLKLETQNRALALASSQATLRTILDSTPEPIVVYDENEFVADVNKQAGDFFGLPRSEMIRRRFRSFLFDDGSLPNKLALVRGRGEYRGEVLALTATGEERTVDLLVRSFIRDGQRYYVAMLHDITQQKNLQETARLSNLRLEQINRELQKVNELRTAFVRTLSQRLRSPMSSIQGFLDMLLEDELGEMNTEQRKAVQSCRRSVARVFGVLDEPIDALPPQGEGSAAAPPPQPSEKARIP